MKSSCIVEMVHTCWRGWWERKEYGVFFVFLLLWTLNNDDDDDDKKTICLEKGILYCLMAHLLFLVVFLSWFNYFEENKYNEYEGSEEMSE